MKLTIIALGLLLLAACSTQRQLTVGIILPFTGDYSSLAESQRNALEMANQKVHAKLIFEDEKSCDPKAAVTAAEKLITVDGVNAIITSACAVGLQSVMPIAYRYKTPFIAPLGIQTFLTGEYIGENIHPEYANYSAGLLPSPAIVWRAHAHEAFKISKRIAIIATQDLGPQLNVRYFKEEYEKIGGKVVLYEETPKGTLDFRTLLLKLDQTDALIWPHLAPDERIAFYRQKNELDLLKGKTILGDLFIDIELAKFTEQLGKNYLDGTITTNFKSTTTQTFKNAYEQRYNKSPNLGADSTYDTLFMLSEAYNTCKGDKTCIASAFKALPYNDASGKIEFNAQGDRIGEPITRVIENGTLVER